MGGPYKIKESKEKVFRVRNIRDFEVNSTIYLWDNLEIIALEYFSWHRKIRLENEGDGSESVMKCFSVLISRKQGRKVKGQMRV